MLVSGQCPAIAEEEPIVPPEVLLNRALDEVKRLGLSLPKEEIDEMYSVVRSGQVPPRPQGADWYTKMVSAGFDPYTAPILSKVLGKQGIPFPKAEEVIERPPPTPPHTARGETPTPKPQWSPKPIEAPRRCELNETRREVMHPESKEERLIADILFIPKELVPLDPDEVLGPSVSLMSYVHEPNDSALYRAALLDAPCVPFRIRITNVATYQDLGNNALHNYGDKQAGAGKLHPIMRDKLFGSRGASRGGFTRDRRAR